MAQYKKLLFIGGGNIAGAVACGLVLTGTIPAKFVTVYDIDSSKLSRFSSLGMNVCSDLLSAPRDSDYIFLAVKPAIVKVVLKELSSIEGMLDRATVVSFAAAVTIQHIINSCGKEMPVIRTMPSTPILIGEGVLAVCHNELVCPKNFEFFCRMMSSVAYVTSVNEQLMNPIISVHGSSPAYVYLFVKAMLDAASKQGIPYESALPLILKTIKGSVSMIEASDKPIDALINEVASPNGTTLAALNAFYENDFTGIVSKAMDACTKRADEISSEL